MSPEILKRNSVDSAEFFLWIPGWGATGSSLSPLVSQYQWGTHIILDPFDLDFSSSDVSAITLKWMAHQYCAFILKNKKPVHLIGHSMGGMIAMHMALINPKLFKSVHLCGTACDGRACLEKGELLNKAKNSDMSPLMRLLELCVSSTFLETEYGKLLQRRFLNPPILLSPKILRYQLNAIKQFDLKGELGQLQVPCFIYAGEKDRIVPIELSRRLVREIPGAALDIFSSGHLFFEESRNEFEQTLRNNVSCFL